MQMNIEWESIKKGLTESKNEVELLELSNKNRATILELGVNENSVLGQVLINALEIKVNNCLRVLGNSDKANIFSFNKMVQESYQGNKLVVANDVFGGIFAINNSDFEGDVRDIWYFSPDSLKWENLEINYAEFISWICGEELDEFYKSFLWKDFSTFAKKVNSEQAILIYPFLWSNQYDKQTATRKIVPIKELIEINAEYQKKIYGQNGDDSV
jgi:hypothetical protein